jgi:hypothetical protein
LQTSPSPSPSISPSLSPGISPASPSPSPTFYSPAPSSPATSPTLASPVYSSPAQSPSLSSPPSSPTSSPAFPSPSPSPSLASVVTVIQQVVYAGYWSSSNGTYVVPIKLTGLGTITGMVQLMANVSVNVTIVSTASGRDRPSVVKWVRCTCSRIRAYCCVFSVAAQSSSWTVPHHVLTL